MEKYLTVEEVAEQLGVHPATVRRWVQSGHIRAVRPGLRAFKIPASEVPRLLASPIRDDRQDGVQSSESQNPTVAAAFS